MQTQEILNPDVGLSPVQVEERPRQALTVAPATPADMVLFAMKNGGTIAELREFMQMQREWEADEARKSYVADMAEFKKNPPQIIKDKEVGYSNKDGTFTGYKHASLGNVTTAIVEGLAMHGFSHSWDVKQDGSVAHVTCKITHRKGHSESVSMQAGKDDSGKKNQIQQVASAISYLQRYTLLAATGLATHDQGDDDGAGAAALDTALADKWCGDAARATTLGALEIVWNHGFAAIKEVGTEFDMSDFKVAVNARKAQLMPKPEANKSSRLRDIVGAGTAEQQQPASE